MKRLSAMHPFFSYFACLVLMLSSLCSMPNTALAAATPGPAIIAEAADSDELTGLQQANIRLMELMTASWFLAVGCSIGSFLNVVAWRLPLGMKLGSPGSRCPACGTSLSRRDNIPVLGWILLRGRCRYCGVSISPRYPIVEALVGAVFVGLLYRELLSGGACLAVRRPNFYHGVVWILWYTKWDLVGIYLFHSLLLSALLAMALIALDSSKVPLRLVVWVGAAGLVLPVVWPTLHPVPCIVPFPESLLAWKWEVEWVDPIFSNGWTHQVGLHLNGAMNGGAGLAGGLIAGLVLAAGERNKRQQWNTATTLGLAGLFLGWQAALSIVTATVLLRLATAPLSGRLFRRPLPTSVLVAALALLQIVLWRELADLWWWPGPHGWPLVQRLDGPWWLASSTGSSLLLLLLVLLPVSRLNRWQTPAAEPPWEANTDTDDARSQLPPEPHPSPVENPQPPASADAG